MSLRAFLRSTPLLVVALLALPSVAAAQVALTGQVHYADGSIASGVKVIAKTGSITYEATTNASGMYLLQFAPGTYDVGVYFASQGFRGSQKLVSAQTFNSNTTLDLTTNDFMLNGRVVTSTGQPVPNVQLTGYMHSGISWNDLFPTSGADGQFQLRMLPGTFSNLQLTPPAGSPYTLTQLPTETFSTAVTKDFVLASTINLSGQVHFADGSIASGVKVIAKTGSVTHEAITNASGDYVLPLAVGTYDVGVYFASQGFRGSQKLVSAQTFNSNTTLNLTTNDFMLNVRIVNGSGQGVPNVQLTGYMHSGISWNDLFPTSGADGRFQLRMLPGTFSNLQLTPQNNPAYLLTPLPAETFSASVSKEYLMTDSNECALNNGGCSVNATCTNIPGSFTCACNPGYTGDGFTCVELPATLSVTSPNGGEQWGAGSTQSITWSSSGVSNVDIQYSLDNGSSWVLIAANVSASAGAYAWTLPNVASSSARVRISDAQDGNPVDTSDAAFTVAAPARIILNEILANEPGSSTTGEFIELVNVGGSAIDLSGWTLWDATAARHTFASGTVLAAGKALVVFASASAIPAGVPNAVASSTGTLSLANSGDTVTVKNAAGASIDSHTYGSTLASADGVSMNRSPDASAGASFVLHNTLSSLTASAGKHASGAAF